MSTEKRPGIPGLPAPPDQRRVHPLTLKFSWAELAQLAAAVPRGGGPMVIWARRLLLEAAEGGGTPEEERMAVWAREVLLIIGQRETSQS